MLFRTMSSVPTWIFVIEEAGACIREQSRRTAQIPISLQFTRSVVSGGSEKEEASISSKPKIEISSGIRMPDSRKAFMAPKAMLSLLAMRAFGKTVFS